MKKIVVFLCIFLIAFSCYGFDFLEGKGNIIDAKFNISKFISKTVAKTEPVVIDAYTTKDFLDYIIQKQGKNSDSVKAFDSELERIVEQALNNFDPAYVVETAFKLNPETGHLSLGLSLPLKLSAELVNIIENKYKNNLTLHFQIMDKEVLAGYNDMIKELNRYIQDNDSKKATAMAKWLVNDIKWRLFHNQAKILKF
jgi:hypothetical protein